MPTALVPLNEVERLGEHFHKSGYFKDVRAVSQAVVKIVIGQAMGLDAGSSMQGLFVNAQGKLGMTANLMAATILRTQQLGAAVQYDYRVIEHTDRVCKIEYLRRRRGETAWELRGTVTTTIEQFAFLAKGPNAANWKNYPANMLFARNISNGQRWYCSDAFGGAPVYLPDEIPGSGLEVDGNTLEVSEVRVVHQPLLPEPVAKSPRTDLVELEKALTEQGLDYTWVADALADPAIDAPEKVSLLSAEEVLEIQKKLALRKELQVA